MSLTPVPPAPPRRPTGDARRWAAARTEYLAGAEAEAVCRRHDIRTATFLRLAGEQGWRRPDAPAPAPAPAVQNQPLVIPEAPPGAIRDGAEAATPLTAAQMADKAWAMLQAAVAAGRLIEARGWLRLHKDLQPHIREEAAAERRARMDRDAAALSAAEQAPADAVGLQSHCFSPSESNTPDPTGGPPCHPGNAEGVIRDGTALQPPGPGRRDATIQATGSVTQAAVLRPAQPDGCPGGTIMAPVLPGSPPGTSPGFGRDDNEAGSPPGTSPGFGRDDKDAGRAHGLARTDAVRLPLHCFSRPESSNGGPAP
ncbi:MAG: hypothetical protein ACK4Y4_07910 [Brevundimonas sp.]